MIQVVGILNITPDSFSDGGQFDTLKSAVKHAEQMLAEGAAMIDIGGESTRPGALPVPPDLELARVLPVVQALVSNGIRNLSIDTRNASTASACLKAGATWLNDISALTHDPEMVYVAPNAEGVVLMHSQGTPQTMQLAPSYTHVIDEIKAYLNQRIEFALSKGLRKEQLWVDPGLGFGKTLEHNLALLNNLNAFCELAPVYIGPSRKNFIGILTGETEPSNRDYGTIGAVLKAAQQGAKMVRVHHVKAAIQALTTFTLQAPSPLVERS